MVECIAKRLKSLGYNKSSDDDWLIYFTSTKVEKRILEQINLKKIPETLYETFVDIVAAEFLMFKKTGGDINEFNFTRPVKEIKEGDINIVYADGDSSPEQRLDRVINYLLDNSKHELLSYRRLKW